MTTQQPTPLPWAVWKVAPDSDQHQRHIITTADGEHEITSIVHRESDADHIARCVNSHGRLVEALIACANLLADYDVSDGEEGEAWREAVAAIAEATGNPQPEALQPERSAVQKEATFDTAPFPCHCPGTTATSSEMEAEPRMTVASFIGDEWHCECGNQPHTDGFQPCQKNGRLVEPSIAGWMDGELYRCMRCDRIIEWDSARDCGKIVGMTTPEFLGQTEAD
jgi:hypothetical protein